MWSDEPGAGPRRGSLNPSHRASWETERAMQLSDEEKKRTQNRAEQFKRANSQLKDELQSQREQIRQLQAMVHASWTRPSPTQATETRPTESKTSAIHSAQINTYVDAKGPPFQILDDPHRISAWQDEWWCRFNEEWDSRPGAGIWWDHLKQDATADLAVSSLRTLDNGGPMHGGLPMIPHVWRITAVETPDNATSKYDSPTTSPSDGHVTESSPYKSSKSDVQSLNSYNEGNSRPSIDSYSPRSTRHARSDPRDEPKRSKKRPYSATGFEEAYVSTRGGVYRKAVCVHCWVNHTLCDFQGQCKPCREAGIRCVRKLCDASVMCQSPRCPCLHPGQYPERNPDFIVEDGPLPNNSGYSRGKASLEYPVSRSDSVMQEEPVKAPHIPPRPGRRGDYYRPAKTDEQHTENVENPYNKRRFDAPRAEDYESEHEMHASPVDYIHPSRSNRFLSHQG